MRFKIAPVLCGLIFGTSCIAGPDIDQFSLVYLDASGHKLDQSEPTRHLRAANIGHPDLFNIVAQNNLCVSLLKSGQIKSAERSCHTARRLALAERTGSPDPAATQNDHLAAIYSNLGVVNIALGNRRQAELNFARALKVTNHQVAHNLALVVE